VESVKKYPFALVYWIEQPWEHGYYAIESKKDLEGWIEGEEYTMLCDTQPSYVLGTMMKLLKES
jgi:hypothetical protein